MEFAHDWLTGCFWALSKETPLEWLSQKIWVIGGVALGVGFVIFVHELGHFLAAKLFGVKCEKFYVGFDVPITIFGIRLPRTLGKFRWGETEYGIGIIPLGGYVKMLGQDDDPRRAAEERERIRQAHAENHEGDPGDALELDPRSYPAKTVWQRMIIISAGVVMNLITAVLFAATAFAMGVNYTPAVVGDLVAGYPAWEAGVQPGGKVIAVDDAVDEKYFSFTDMQYQIVRASIAAPDDPVNLQLTYDDRVENYSLYPREIEPGSPMRMVGVGMPEAARLALRPQFSPYMVADKVLDESFGDWEIVAVDGVAIDEDAAVGARLAVDMNRKLVAESDATVELTLEAPSDGSGPPEQKTVTLPPQPFKWFGLKLGVGPISSLVTGGPADEAGLEIGDTIVGFGDQEGTLDCFSLPRAVADTSGSITLKILRAANAGDETEDAAELESVTLQPVGDAMTRSPFVNTTGHVELEKLGLTFKPSLEVVGFDDASGSGDGDASPVKGIAIGDVLEQVTVLWPEDKRPQLVEDYYNIRYLGTELIEKLESGWNLNDENHLVSLLLRLQDLPPDTKFKLVFAKGDSGKITEVESTLVETNQFWYDRGLNLVLVSLIHKSDSVGEAMSLGFREAKLKAKDVLDFLKFLLSGRVSFKRVGGPVAIVSMAGGAASEGFSELLLFLTLLSVNLAILNFLPIPALDGGHMVFLAAEAVRGKPVDEEIQARITMVGVLALLCLMGFVIVNDVLRIASN